MLTQSYYVSVQTADRGQGAFGQRVTTPLTHAKDGRHNWVRQIQEPECEVAAPYGVFGELTMRLSRSFAAETFVELWETRSGSVARGRGVLLDVSIGKQMVGSSDDEPLMRSTTNTPLDPHTKAVGLRREAAHSEPALIGLNADRAGQRAGA